MPPWEQEKDREVNVRSGGRAVIIDKTAIRPNFVLESTGLFPIAWIFTERTADFWGR